MMFSLVEGQLADPEGTVGGVGVEEDCLGEVVVADHETAEAEPRFGDGR